MHDSSTTQGQSFYNLIKPISSLRNVSLACDVDIDESSDNIFASVCVESIHIPNQVEVLKLKNVVVTQPMQLPEGLIMFNRILECDSSLEMHDIHDSFQFPSN